jgi:hypothetical protein
MAEIRASGEVEYPEPYYARTQADATRQVYGRKLPFKDAET